MTIVRSDTSMRKVGLRISVLAGLIVFFATSFCLGQNLSSISGLVSDPQGRMISGAAVTSTNTATGVETRTVTNSSGFYSTLNLPVGTYVLMVERLGFRQYVQSGIILSTAQTLGLNVRMEVGTVAQTVQVTGTQPLLETRTSDIGQVFTSENVKSLPLQNRRPLQLVALTGAATFISYSSITGNAVPRFSLAGGRSWDQTAWLDGANVQNVRLGAGQINLDPPVEVIQEVRVLENNYSAQYGGSAGGVIVETSKSGTNQFHGSAYENFQNDALNAAGFFAPIQNDKKLKPELRFNLFGGTIGGPIRKDKTFFFFSYEAARLRQGRTRVITVPTPLQRTGDFSQTFNTNGQLINIYDPSTTQLVNGVYVRSQFPGNVIPTSKLDPVAVNVMKYYPLPNQAPSNLAGANNFGANSVIGTTGNFYMIKLDHTISNKDKLTGWYISDDTSARNTTFYPLQAGDPQNFSVSLLHYGYASWIHIFGPSQVNNLSYTYTYRTFHNMSWGLGGNYPSKLGLQGVPERAFPTFVVSGFSQLGSSTQERIENPTVGQTIVDNFSWVLGRHSLVFGFQGTRSADNELFLSSVSGLFGFSTKPTELPGNAGTGSGLASFLVGFPNNFSENSSQPLARRSWYLAGFIQDDWTVTPDLTLNMGLRWDTDTPVVDAHNHMNSFDPTQINPVSGTPGVVKFVGLNGWPRKPYSGRWNNFGPRFGFAWKPFHSGNTVVRGGYGIFYDHPFDDSVVSVADLGFSVSANLISPDNGITAPFLLRDGVPVPATAPVLDDSFGAVPVGTSPTTAVEFFKRDRPTGMSQQFNLGVQRELGRGMMLGVTALGNVSRHMPSLSISINQIAPSVLGPTTDTQQYRPFPQFSDVSWILPPNGVVNYFAGMARVEKRFSDGLSFNAVYTYSRFLDNGDPQNGNLGSTPGYSNFYNPGADYGPSSNEIVHHLVFGLVYELPFGSGKRWLAQSPLRYVAGGWTLSNVTTIQSGPPLTVTTQTNTTNAFSAGDLRPNLIGKPALPSGERTVEKWFNTEAFAQPAQFKFGNAGVGIVRAPGLVNSDFSVLRDFRLPKRVNLQFRGDFFNAFNRTNLGLPDTIFGAADFGTIESSGPARVVQLGAEFVF